MRIEDINPDKKLTKVYNEDYKGIEIVKEPGGLRKHYIMKILAERTPASGYILIHNGEG